METPRWTQLISDTLHNPVRLQKWMDSWWMASAAKRRWGGEWKETCREKGYADVKGRGTHKDSLLSKIKGPLEISNPSSSPCLCSLWSLNGARTGQAHSSLVFWPLKHKDQIFLSAVQQSQMHLVLSFHVLICLHLFPEINKIYINPVLNSM